jgi:hypothetical protein
LNGRPIFWRFFFNVSRFGGAMKTTNGFKSEVLRFFKDCGWKLHTQILPVFTTDRMASRLVP